ncbi:MAG TPA: hypothetical protein VFV99_15840 [Kofleriaceae bacterium]|nr:hypothetical protein [Kofleriaceae bacterium]
MRAAIVFACLASNALTAHADSFEDHDTFGLDVSTAWEPANGDAFGAGPMFRFETFTSRMPDWLGLVSRFGVIVDSADRVYSPVAIGLEVRHDWFYYTVEGGATLASRDSHMDDALYFDWTFGAAAGVRLGHWDLRANVMLGGLFDKAVWMFSVGRDFVRIDSKITRTTL